MLTSTTPDPLLGLALLAAGWVHLRGRSMHRSRTTARRSWSFYVGLTALAVALLSPLEALSRELVSAHMIQHVLLVLVAAPALALAAPGPALLRGLPAGTARRVVGLRDRLPAALLAAPDNPVLVWLAHAGALWLWHAAVLYQAALERPFLHVLEHAAFGLTAYAFWRLVVRAGRRDGPSRGGALLMVFGMALQGVLLSALLTFAERPWYPAYAGTAPRWGLEPLADQQLAGLIMWIPGGLVYLLAGLLLLGAWLRESDGIPSVPARGH